MFMFEYLDLHLSVKRYKLIIYISNTFKCCFSRIVKRSFLSKVKAFYKKRIKHRVRTRLSYEPFLQYFRKVDLKPFKGGFLKGRNTEIVLLS